MSFEEVLYKITYEDFILYSAVIPSYTSEKTDSQVHISGKSEQGGSYKGLLNALRVFAQ